MKNKRSSNAEIEVYARQGSHVGSIIYVREEVDMNSTATDGTGNLTKIFSLH